MVHTLKLYTLHVIFGQHYIITFDSGTSKDTATFLYVTQFHYNIYNIHMMTGNGEVFEANIENIEKVVD